MAQTWTNLPEEADRLQTLNPQRLADSASEGEAQVPLRRSCALVPKVQDAHEGAQVRASPWPQVR
jgi:hypothetical protein